MDLPAKELLVANKVKNYCDHIFWSNDYPFPNMRFKGGDVVFCKIDEVLNFFEKLRLTRKKIVLVTGEGCLPCNSFKQQFLPANVLAWFANNVANPHPKVHPMPLGLGMSNDHVTLELSNILLAREKTDLKKNWLYVNFRPETNPELRQKIYDHFKVLSKKETWVTFEQPHTQGENKAFLKEIVSHYFVLSPPGRGFDTHRLWETLLAGSYPIVLRSPAMEAFSSMPILFVDHIEQITKDFLEENLELLEKKKSDLEMLQMSFWKKKIEEEKQKISKENCLSLKEWFKESLVYGWEMLQRRCS